MNTRNPRRILASAAVAAVAAVSSPLHSQETVPMPPPPPPPPPNTFASYGYAWTEFGGSFPDSVDATSLTFSAGAPIESFTLDLKPGFSVQGGFGDQLTPWFAMEFQAGLLFNPLEDVRNVGTIQSLDGDLFQVPLFLNAVFTFPVTHQIQPFAGIGGGAWLSWLDASQIVSLTPGTTTRLEGSDVEITVGYQAFAGVRFDFSDMSSFRVTYRLMGADGPDWTLDDPVTMTDAGRIELDSLLVHSISIGFLFEF